MKLTYTDQGHVYFLNGKRAKSVTAVAKIAADDQWAIQKWHERMIAIGTMIDGNVRENIAAHLDDKIRLGEICEDAKKVAKSHVAADRGTQMHRVLQLILLEQEYKLLTEQQQRDADVLKRTLDHYKLTPFDSLTEQFVAWPHYCVTGRFDAVLERANGDLILVDLKSGVNAILYPDATAAQLAMYGRAPHISDNIHVLNGKQTVTDWREMPSRLDRRVAYVLLVEPDADVGVLHEVDIEAGWSAAVLALGIIEWRRERGGKRLVREVDPDEFTGQRLLPPSWLTLVRDARDLPDLRLIWQRSVECGQMTPELAVMCRDRAKELSG